MALLRNVPPSPANYAQRSGRAGRRHRIGAVFAYCRNVQHDQYFYGQPPAMISGEVRVPGFSMRNEPLIRQHVFSAVLTELRGRPGAGEVLAETFPSYIWHYFGTKGDPEDARRWKYRLGAPDFSAFPRASRGACWRPTRGAGLDLHQPVAGGRRLGRVRERAAPDDRRDARRAGARRQDSACRGAELSAHPGRAAGPAGSRRVPVLGRGTRRNNYEAALHRLWADSQDNYSISYLARRGFFPGYGPRPGAGAGGGASAGPQPPCGRGIAGARAGEPHLCQLAAVSG